MKRGLHRGSFLITSADPTPSERLAGHLESQRANDPPSRRQRLLPASDDVVRRLRASANRALSLGDEASDAPAVAEDVRADTPFVCERGRSRRAPQCDPRLSAAEAIKNCGEVTIGHPKIRAVPIRPFRRCQEIVQMCLRLWRLVRGRRHQASSVPGLMSHPSPTDSIGYRRCRAST
jgi:hypothetical protein